MTIQAFLAAATQRLQAADIPSARLDCLILLEDALGRDRAWLLAHPEAKIDQTTEVELNKKIVQRTAHTPLAYIRGKAHFFGRTFAVRPGVLVPRPETEAMIELFTLHHFDTPPRIADIGTGSGCLGITAALELPGSKLDLYDIDPTALQIAAQNAQNHGLEGRTLQEDLLGGMVGHKYDVVLANLPYVPDDFPVDAATTHEPPTALFAGQDGLDIYRRFWQDVQRLHHKPALVITEAFTQQHTGLTKLARHAGYQLKHHQGLAQAFVPA